MTKKQEDLIEKINNYNSEEYLLNKLGEEAQELGLAITQFRTKPDNFNFQEIIDEVGDVYIRLKLFRNFMKKYQKDTFNKVEERVNFKMNKYEQYLKEQKYQNI